MCLVLRTLMLDTGGGLVIVSKCKQWVWIGVCIFVVFLLFSKCAHSETITLDKSDFDSAGNLVNVPEESKNVFRLPDISAVFIVDNKAHIRPGISAEIIEKNCPWFLPYINKYMCSIDFGVAENYLFVGGSVVLTPGFKLKIGPVVGYDLAESDFTFGIGFFISKGGLF